MESASISVFSFLSEPSVSKTSIPQYPSKSAGRLTGKPKNYYCEKALLLQQ